MEFYRCVVILTVSLCLAWFMVLSTESFLESTLNSLSRVTFVRMINCNVENKHNFVQILKHFKITNFALQNIPNKLVCSMQIDEMHYFVF